MQFTFPEPAIALPPFCPGSLWKGQKSVLLYTLSELTLPLRRLPCVPLSSHPNVHKNPFLRLVVCCSAQGSSCYWIICIPPTALWCFCLWVLLIFFSFMLFPPGINRAVDKEFRCQRVFGQKMLVLWHTEPERNVFAFSCSLSHLPITSGTTASPAEPLNFPFLNPWMLTGT